MLTIMLFVFGAQDLQSREHRTNVHLHHLVVNVDVDEFIKWKIINKSDKNDKEHFLIFFLLR